MHTTVRPWRPATDAQHLQAGLALASLLMGDGLDAPRSSVPAARVDAFLNGVACWEPGHWAPPLPARVFAHGGEGAVCTFEDGSAFHLAPIQGDRRRPWRACASLFMGPETLGSCSGWTERDAEAALALSRRLPRARLPHPASDWLLAPTPLDLAMPSPAANRPKALVRQREAALVGLARLVLGTLRMDLVFSHGDSRDQVAVGTDPMGIGIPTPRTIPIAQDMHDPAALDALCVAAGRLFPGRLGLCRLPHAELPEHVVQAFARVRAAEVNTPASAHARMVALGAVHTDHPELLPFLHG